MLCKILVSLTNSSFFVATTVIGLCIELDDDVIKALQSARRIKVEDEKKPIITSAETDMQNCFGFDVSRSVTCKKLRFSIEMFSGRRGGRGRQPATRHSYLII